MLDLCAHEDSPACQLVSNLHIVNIVLYLKEYLFGRNINKLMNTG